MKALVLVALLSLVGCAAPHGPRVGRVRPQVPDAFSYSVGSFDKSPSHYERYLEGFREGYWDCIWNYTRNINYISTESDYSNRNGWISEIAGYRAGYAAAEKDMQRNIGAFGKARTAKYLKSISEGGF